MGGPSLGKKEPVPRESGGHLSVKGHPCLGTRYIYPLGKQFPEDMSRQQSHTYVFIKVHGVISAATACSRFVRGFATQNKGLECLCKRVHSTEPGVIHLKGGMLASPNECAGEPYEPKGGVAYEPGH